MEYGRFADRYFADTYNCIKTAFHDTDILVYWYRHLANFFEI